MKRNIYALIFGLLLLGSNNLYAQQELQITSIFQKFGNQKGATYVELSKTLSKEWEINHYKSLKLSKAEKALPDIYRSLEVDKQNAKKIKEVIINGEIQSGYYQLPPLKGNINRFILFRVGKKEDATLIYIEGEIDSDDLVTLMFSKE